MLRKEITIDGRPVQFKASASVPRMYRIKFRRDIFHDMKTIREAMEEEDPDGSNLPMEALELFENVAYIMALGADPKIPATVEEWLDGFGTFSIYEVFPEILELWGMNTETEIAAKKNRIRRRGK